MFMRYHVLDRLLTGQDKFINLYGTNTYYLNPTEWMGTLLEHSTIKIEKADEMITVKETAANPPVPEKGRYYLNHAYETLVGGKHVPGALITKPDTINYTQSLAIYYLDDVIAFDTDMRETVMNTRIRTDFMTLWPELSTNNIRMNGKALKGDETNTDRKTKFTGKGINY
jgi:hypothetical protein